MRKNIREVKPGTLLLNHVLKDLKRKVETRTLTNGAALVTKAAYLVGEQISTPDTEACYRVPTKNTGQSIIIIRSPSKSKTDAGLEKAKKERSSCSGISVGRARPLFIAKHKC